MNFHRSWGGRALIGAAFAAFALRGVPGMVAGKRGNIVFDGVGIIAGGVLLLFGFAWLHRKRAIESVPVSRVRSVAMGFANLEGKAESRTPLAAPYSQIPCVFYRYLVEEERQRPRGGTEWTTVERGQSPDMFYLRDGEDGILVDPDGVETVLQRSFQKVERGEGLLAHRRRYSEWWVVQGQKLFIAGTVRGLRDAVRDHRAALGDRLRALKHDPEKMKALDTNRDGQVSPDEWDQGVRAEQDALVREEAAQAPEKPEEMIAVGKGSEESTFILADRSERSLLGRLALQSGAALVGGAAAVVIFLVSFLARSGVLHGGWIVPW